MEGKTCLCFTATLRRTMEQSHNLRSYMKTNNPNVWKFVIPMDKLLADYDLELKRLENGLQITRIPKLKTR